MVRPYKSLISKPIDVCMLGKGQVFGEDDIIESKPRTYTVISLSADGIVYSMSKQVKTQLK